MAQPAFIVDGHLEQLIITHVCKNAVIRRLNTNGTAVAVRKMAEACAKIIRILNNRYYPIYIVCDREDRIKSCDDIEQEFVEFLTEFGIETSQVRVVFCDRMIENWILSDDVMIQETYGYTVEVVEVEGCHGKSVLKGILASARETYSETIDGFRLFKKCDPMRIAANSRSFRKLVDTWEGHCYWLAGCRSQRTCTS